MEVLAPFAVVIVRVRGRDRGVVGIFAILGAARPCRSRFPTHHHRTGQAHPHMLRERHQGEFHMPRPLAGGEIIDHPCRGIAHGQIFEAAAGGRRLPHRIGIVERQRDLGILLLRDLDLDLGPDIHLVNAAELHEAGWQRHPGTRPHRLVRHNDGRNHLDAEPTSEIGREGGLAHRDPLGVGQAPRCRSGKRPGIQRRLHLRLEIERPAVVQRHPGRQDEWHRRHPEQQRHRRPLVPAESPQPG